MLFLVQKMGKLQSRPHFTQPFTQPYRSLLPILFLLPHSLCALCVLCGFPIFNHKERKVHKAVVKALRLYNHFTSQHGVWGETPAIKPHEHPERIQQSNHPMASTTPFALFASFAARIPLPPNPLNPTIQIRFQF